MPHIIATDRPTLWAVEKNNEVLAAGLMSVGGLTVTGSDKTLLSDPDENAFLGKVAGKAGTFPPLPDAGTALEAGRIYAYGANLVIVRQAHTRTEHAPADVPALFSVYREDASDALEWIANEPVLVGTRRLYNGTLYEAITAHTTQTDWTPPNVPALWAEVVSEPEPGAWAAGVAYKVNDLVTYNGSTYKCLQAHTSQAGWTPVAVPAMWQKQ